MLNALALLTGFIVTLFVFIPQPSQPNEEEAIGIKINSRPVAYYPNPVEEVGQSAVLAETEEVNQENIQTPTLTPTPTEVNADTTPSPLENNQPSQSPSSFIMDQINSHRTSNGLSAYQSHTEVCSFAQTRLNELQNSFTHEGFNQRLQSNSFPYANFSQVAENIADAPSYMEVFNMWQNSPGHNQNLLSGMPYACVAGSGRIYVFESWTP